MQVRWFVDWFIMIVLFVCHFLKSAGVIFMKFGDGPGLEF